MINKEERESRIKKEKFFTKLLRVLKRDGFFKVFKRLVLLPLTITRKKIFEGKNFNLPRAEVFSAIHSSNYWGDQESVSGSGSTLEYTNNTREKLLEIIDQFNITKIVDLCCGDFNWMSKITNSTKVNYIGIDIVPSLIKNNNDKYSDTNVSFIIGDACQDKIPDCDLLILRDCLFHFSFSDTNKALANLKNTDYRYLLTTTYLHGKFEINKDITTGDFRFIDLSCYPYNFNSSKSLFSISEPAESGINRSMVLFEKSDVPEELSTV